MIRTTSFPIVEYLPTCMEDLIRFFEHVPMWFRTMLLLGGIAFFWAMEGVLPLFRFSYRKLRHGFLNLFFTMTTAVIGFTFAGLLLMASRYVTEYRLGLLYLVELPLAAEVVVGVLLLDLIGAYTIHWIEHRVKWMWKFHLVHHSDTTVDVTTGLRHHPGETVFRMLFTILAVFISGTSIGIVMLYQSLSVLFAHLTHANLRIPETIDRWFSYVWVTPNMHKVHHHFRQPYTDSNYGNIFSIWDRVFGTFSSVGKATKLRYGINTHMDEKENDRLGNLLVMPLQPYRSPADHEIQAL